MNKTLILSQKEIYLITSALEHITRLGIWNEEYEQLLNKLNS